MSALVRAFGAGLRAELLQLSRTPLLLALAVVQAVTFLVLVSLFGLTGSRAPTALIDQDHGVYARRFIADLERAHHSFALRPMTAHAASQQLLRGDLVASITIPRGFSRDIARADTVPLKVTVDNVDADLTDDIQRALPSAIVAFARQSHLPNIRLHAAELDLINHDTGFIPYLVVSALALDALVVAGILSAVAVAREFESGTARFLATTPAPVLAPLAGRLTAAAAVSFLAMMLTVVIVIAGYGVMPLHPFQLLAALILCVVLFSCLGAALGAGLRRTLPIASLVFGLSLPLYIDSGSLEPERFDGNTIWTLAHLSPVYYAVGVLEDAVHGLQVTPEPVAVDLLALAGWALLGIVIAAICTRKRVTA